MFSNCVFLWKQFEMLFANLWTIPLGICSIGIRPKSRLPAYDQSHLPFVALVCYLDGIMMTPWLAAYEEFHLRFVALVFDAWWNHDEIQRANLQTIPPEIGSFGESFLMRSRWNLDGQLLNNPTRNLYHWCVILDGIGRNCHLTFVAQACYFLFELWWYSDYQLRNILTWYASWDHADILIAISWRMNATWNL